MTAGRPKKMVSIAKVQEHFLTDTDHAHAFDETAEEYGMTKVEFFNFLIDMVNQNDKLKTAMSKLDLQKKAIEAQKKADEYRSQLAQIEFEERQREEIAAQIKRTNAYLISAFEAVAGKGREITMYPDAIEKLYGISLDIDKYNRNRQSVMEMDEQSIIRYLGIKRVAGHAKKEEEILRKIGGI
ncbi:MAG: hypothetical protein RE471_03090 [Ferroplasma sp.]|uniref:hypothetical protein n=1 Tax=Ferroplasma sp. TaxID=2591003 RepID=UPI002814E4AB|nr:hypothetical protein [Ferroplasma sp.]WMT51873.1 MAG: hypothetical protein RE471_03090 [Ferroplasma sp.]